MNFMGQEIYTDYWKSILQEIRNGFQAGQNPVQVNVQAVTGLGDRKPNDYSGYSLFRFGVPAKNKDSAVYRNLVEAIQETTFLKPYLNNELNIKVNSKLMLEASYTVVTPDDLIKAYKQLVKNGNPVEIYKWETLGRQYWNWDAKDLVAMFKAIPFANLVYHNSKAVMHTLLKKYPEEMKDLFKNLFDENIDLYKRIISFREETMRLYRTIEENYNTHQDERSIATYLTFMYPEKYSLYKESFYNKYCKMLNIPVAEVNKKYIHYLSLISEFIDRYVKEDKELLLLVNKFKPENGFADPNYTLLAQDILYKTLEGAWKESEEEAPEEINLIQNSSVMSLNTILYGPPGTGKTYNTINKAVAIANPQFDISKASREQLKEEYERLVKDGQIEFITFHQSMSYEDFIEGIKPMEPKEGDGFLKYEIRDGIFKRLAERASKVPEMKPTGFSISDDEFQKAGFYKLSLGDTSNPDDDQIYEWCIKNGYIALGRGDANDFTGMNESDIQHMVPGKLEKYTAQAVNFFIHYIKPGDYVVVTYGNLLFRAIGKVTGNYEFKNVGELNVHQFRKVDWLVTDIELPYEELYERQFQQQCIYRLDKKAIKKDFFVKTDSVVKQPDNKPKNYVLIIDEINRGNVSQIFGELITLIEDDKRAGKEEALTVILPYSKKPFSVPANLYIIGTMNTADRSVEALDTALRRRFVFKEMMPLPDLLHPKQVLCSFWNKFEHAGVDYDEWFKEPYKSITDVFYSLIGITRELEAFFYDNDPDVERKYWIFEDFTAIKDDQFTGIRLDNLLQAINERLQVLLTKDHTIGHAWLMNVYSLEDLQGAFKNKILPLLQEFFYHDYGKIGLVLGDAFVAQTKANKGLFAKFKDAAELSEDYDGKTMFTLKDPFSLGIVDFQSIYQ